jgi:tetratricopeptide (TPR) repeat protein
MAPSAVMGSHNFDLKLCREVPKDPREGPTDFVEVLGCPSGRSEKPTPLVLPAGLDKRVAAINRGASCEDDCVDLGRDLFNSLFSKEIRDHWLRSQGALNTTTMLRLRLDIRSPELASLPWEMVYESPVFLAMAPQRPVVRSSCPPQGVLPSRRSSPLKVLIASAIPTDLPFLPNAETEARAINSSLAPLVLAGRLSRPEILEHATFESLQRHLRQGFDVLHFIGHGEFNEKDHKGYLYVEGDDRRCRPLGPRQLTTLLTGNSLRLLVLNSCKTAVPSRLDPLLGVADAALAAKIPAVVAMRSAIPDQTAKVFARAFYEVLAEGKQLEICMAEARKCVMGKTGLDRADWAIPVLFSNAADGRLWQTPARRRAGSRREAPSDEPAMDGPILENLSSPDYPRLVGREHELERLIAALSPDSGSSLVMITGPNGVGRTALARAVALHYLNKSRQDPRGPYAFHGIVWYAAQTAPDRANLPCPTTLDDLCQTVAAVLDNKEILQQGPETRRRLISVALLEARYLLIIDDADRIRDPELTAFLKEIRSPTRAIVISHDPLPGINALELAVPNLGRSAARTLLLQDDRLAQGPGLEATSPREFEELAEKAQGLPLVLRLAAAQIADSGEPVSSTIQQLSEAGQRSLPEHYVDRLLRDLEPEARSVLLGLAVFPHATRREAALAVGELEEPNTDQLLSRLVQLRFLEKERADLFGMRPTIRHQVLSSASPAMRDSAIRRATEYLCRFVNFNAKPGNRPGMSRLGLEVGNLLWAVRQAKAMSEWQKVVRFRRALGDFLYWSGHWNEAIEIGQLAFAAAGRVGDVVERAWCALYPLAHVNFHRASFDAAEDWCEQSLAIFRREKHDRGQVDGERLLGRVKQAKGEYDRACELFTVALAKARCLASASDEDRNREANLMASLGGLEEERKDYERARHYFEAALAVYQQTKDQMGIAATFHRLGSIAMARHQYGEAERLLLDSLEGALTCEWANRVSEVSYTLAILAEDRGDLEEAQARLYEVRGQFVSRSAAADVARVDATLTRISAQLTYRNRRNIEKGERLGDLPTGDPLYRFLVGDVLSRVLGIETRHPTFEAYELGTVHQLDRDESHPSVFRYVERGLGLDLVGKFYGDRWISGWEAQDRELLKGLMLAEFDNLNRVRSLGFDGYPYRVVRPLATSEEVNCVLVEEYASGLDLESFIREAIRTGDHETLFAKLTQVASFLAELHERSRIAQPVDQEASLAYYRRVIGQLAGAKVISAEQQERLAAIGDDWGQSGLLRSASQVYIHGDAMPAHFVFEAEDEMTVIDFERYAPGDRAADLGRMAAEIHHLFSLHDRDHGGAKTLVERFVSDYTLLLPNGRQDAAELGPRVEFYRGCDQLRISRNRWLDLAYRQRLAAAALDSLEATRPSRRRHR